MTAVADVPAIVAEPGAAPIFVPWWLSWWRAASLGDRARIIFALTWIVSVGYLASWIAHGWIPHDDGLIAQSAERVLRGQLPHRDFDEMYTGGLSALHAAAFAVLGTRLLVLRLLLLAAAAVWVPTVYAIARRFATPGLAGLATLAAVVWSVPNYSAAMPSWYNLYFATGGLLALLKHAETRRTRWLIAAGICGGLSLLIKIIGLYFLAAAGLYLLYSAYDRAYDSAADRDRGRQRADGVTHLQDDAMRRSAAVAASDPRIGRAVALAATVLMVAAIAALVRPAASSATYFYFVLPTAATCVGIVVRAWNAAGFSWRHFWLGALSLTLGVAAAVVPFVALYAHAHALGSLYSGVLVLPARRYGFAIGAPTWPGVLPIGMAAVFLATLPVRARWVGASIAVVAVAVLEGLYSPHLGQAWDATLVEAVRAMLPLLACGFAALTVWLGPPRVRERRAQTVAVMAVASLCALVAYPFFGMIYFFYYAPLVVLAAVAVFSVFGQPGGKLAGLAGLAFCVAFAVNRRPPRDGALIATARGGIFVNPADSAEAQTLVDVMHAHARNGYTFATPDCPEVYFLTGLSNPTPTMFDFFADTAGRTDRLMRLLIARRITAITVNRQPLFSGGPDPRLIAALAARYPDSVRFGRYTVRWRGDDSSATADAGASRSHRAAADSTSRTSGTGRFHASDRTGRLSRPDVRI